jgi:hypothetical protein
MRKTLLLSLFFLFLGFNQIFAQAVGDYGSNSTNIWGTGYSWLVCTSAGTWAGATTTTTQPSSSKNVWIKGTDVVTISQSVSSSVNCKNLYVQNGATLTVGNNASSVTLNCYGNLTVEAGGTLNSASTSSSIQNGIAFQPVGLASDLIVDGNFGDNNSQHLINILPKIASLVLNIKSNLASPSTMYTCVIKPQVASSTVNFQRDITLTNASVGLAYANASNTGYDNTTYNIVAGKTVTTTGSVAITTSGVTTPVGGGGCNNSQLNVNGTLLVNGNLSLKNLPGNTFSLNVGSTGILTVVKHFNLPANAGLLSMNVSSGALVSFSGSADTCYLLPSAVTGTMNGTWDFSNTLSAPAVRGLGALVIGGKVILPDATIPSVMTLATGSTVEYQGSSSYALPSSPTDYYNLTINNSAGVTLGASTNILESLTVSSGSIELGNNDITLKSSSASNTAYFAATGVTAPFTYGGTGVFICEKYITGGGSGFPVSGNSKRGYRFMSHPLNVDTALSQIIGASEIAVTGSGGSANGFTTTGTNSPSAFTYNPNAANAGSVSGVSSGGSGPSDPGWAAFTDATSNNWKVGQGIRVFYRGSAAQGLTSADYTVGSTTINFKGQLSVGGATGLVVNLIYGVTGYNLVGNPFASPVNLKNVLRTNVSNFVYVFKADQGNRGGYGTVDVSNDYLLPAYAGFFAQATAASPTLTFEEADKANTQTADVLFRNNTVKNSVKLKLVDANTFWDELEVRMDKAELSVYNAHDAVKFFNPDVNLYSISAEGKYLSIDSRNNTDIVPLGLMANTARSFTLKVDAYNMEQGVELYLIDKFLHTETKIEAGMEYGFSTSSNAGSQGDNRFEIARKTVPAILLQPSFTVKAYPNPVADKLQISFSGTSTEENTAIRIVGADGMMLKTIDAGKLASGSQSIPTKGWANGAYLVQLINGKNIQTQSIIKQ